MRTVGFFIATEAQFDFCQTVFSHGWYLLSPFAWDADRHILSTIYQTAAGDVLQLCLSATESGIRVELPDLALLGADLQDEIATVVRAMLNIDWDLRDFYAAMRHFAGYDWLENERRGRILVAASLWEDLVKVLLTTNCTWAQTIDMSRRLCQLGPPHPKLPDRHAFPSANQVAGMAFADLAAAVRAGYRNAYLHELAQRIAAGELDLDSWAQLDSDSLFQAVKSLKGFGDYAAGTIVRMRGYFDKIAIDSACREMVATLHNDGVRGSDKDIKSHYARFGKWQGLVMWMDIMRKYD